MSNNEKGFNLGDTEYLVSHPHHNNLFYVTAYSKDEAIHIVWEDTKEIDSELDEEGEKALIEIVKVIKTKQI